MNKTQTIASLAEKTGLAKAQVASLLDELAKLAYQEAANGFVIPGIGKLVLVKRKARMGRNPATGATIKIPAKTIVKMRVGKAAKDSIVPAKK